MLTTKRLFDDNPYGYQFSANVTFVGEDYIILDQTLFYPFSGNQDFDTGTIEGEVVTAVYVDAPDEGRLDFSAPIKHFVITDKFNVGQCIRGNINSVRREATMRLHTASHLVEFFVKKNPEFLSVEGSLVNSVKDRTDYLLAKNIDSQGLAELELQINNFIKQGHSVTFEFEDGLRIWCCDEIRMPCCGTHVLNTSEIGQVKLSRKNKGKGLNRIECSLT